MRSLKDSINAYGLKGVMVYLLDEVSEFDNDVKNEDNGYIRRAKTGLPPNGGSAIMPKPIPLPTTRLIR